MQRNVFRRSIPVLFGLFVLLTSSCSSDEPSLQDAAAELDVPESFVETSSETLNGFEATTRSLTFTTELSQNDACDLVREALTTWADQEFPEPQSALPRNICSHELSNPANHPDIDTAVGRVFRAKVGDEFIEDGDQPGGVEEITIFFRTDK